MRFHRDMKINVTLYLFDEMNGRFSWGGGGGDCIGSLLLHGGFLSSCGERELLIVAVHRLLIVVASLVVEHGL